jgi:uncharacterized protein with PQ loop repeat
MCQCFYYRGFTWKDEVIPSKPNNIGEANERTGLLPVPHESRERRSSVWSQVSASHLSPVVPLIDAPKRDDPPVIPKQTTRLQATLFNLFSILMVCAAGVLGWWVSNRGSHLSEHPKHPSSEDVLQFSLWGQIFGYFCAVLYLGSRIPQLLLNYRRKSTEGVSMLFFLFACIGNLTYVLSIFAYEPHCSGKHGRCAKGEAAAIYVRYILVNTSWLAGSLGTLFLDMTIFAQFFLYRNQDEEGEEEAIESENGASNGVLRDERPLLSRGDSEYP